MSNNIFETIGVALERDKERGLSLALRLKWMTTDQNEATFGSVMERNQVIYEQVDLNHESKDKMAENEAWVATAVSGTSVVVYVKGGRRYVWPPSESIENYSNCYRMPNIEPLPYLHRKKDDALKARKPDQYVWAMDWSYVAADGELKSTKRYFL